MMFWDIAIWLAVAKVIVMLAEDAAWGVFRGKQSPRQRERAQHQAAEAAGKPIPKAAGGVARTRAAVGGYLAGAVEDATANARARRRRAQARKRGDRAIDGVFVDIDDSDGFHADCDVCGWSSRPYRIEANALAAGREHTRTEHPEQYTEDPTPEPQPADTAGQPDPATAQPTDGAQPADAAAPQPETASSPAEAQPADDEPVVGRPKLTVIPGGATDTAAAPAGRKPAATPAGAKPQTAAAGDAPEDEDGPTPKTEAQWRREREAIRASALDLLVGMGRCIYSDLGSTTFCREPVDDDVEGAVLCRYHRRREYMQQLSARGRCIQPGAGENGLCGQLVHDDTEACAQHQDGPNSLRQTWGRECQACGERAEGFASEQAARDDAAGHRCPAPSQDPAGASSDAPTDLASKTPANETGAGIPAGATTKENTVNLEATGPDEIRHAFATSAEVTREKAEELTGLAGVLVEAADRYEGMKMAGSTVEHLREAAESMQAAKASMDTATEQLEAALADFNARDGVVADTVTDTGGNVASEDVLVGG